MNPGRWEALYAVHIEEATRLAYLVVGDHGLAQDLAHDAFLKSASRLHGLREQGSFGPYLRRTIVNLAISRGRRKRAEQRALARAGVPSQLGTPHAEIPTEDVLRRALWTLPVRQRAALVLRYYVDLSEEETAEILGSSVVATKSLVARGVRALRNHASKEEWHDIASR
jgi:RNA polymerase sigma factor (sigma-70 family)